MKTISIQKDNYTHIILPMFYNLDPVGYCYDRCPSFDGKRCDILGRQPYHICQPYTKWAAENMLNLLGACQDLLRFIETFDMGGDWCQDNYPAIKKAKTIIAKITETA